MRTAPIFATLMLAAAALGPAYAQNSGDRPQGPNSLNGTKSDQRAGESAVGKNQPNRPEDSTGSKARAIHDSAGPVTLSPDQKAKAREALAQAGPKRVDHVDYTIMIGAAVPRQAELGELPPAVSQALGGYEGDGYVLVRDQLIIVDKEARRIVAIIPGMA